MLKALLYQLYLAGLAAGLLVFALIGLLVFVARCLPVVGSDIADTLLPSWFRRRPRS